MVDRVLRGVGDRAAERARGHVDVGIGEQQPRTAGLFRAQGQGMDLAQPAFGQLFDVNRNDPRIGCGHAVDDGRGAVAGTIVDEDDFQLGIVLLQDRAQGRFERGGLIAGRNDDRELGPGLRRRRVGLRKQRHGTNDAQRAHEHPKPIDAADECVSDENAVESHRPLERPFQNRYSDFFGAAGIRSSPLSVFDVSAFGTSDFGASHFGASDFGASDFGASDFGGSDFGASAFDGSAFGASDFGASDFGASLLAGSFFSESSGGASGFTCVQPRDYAGENRRRRHWHFLGVGRSGRRGLG